MSTKNPNSLLTESATKVKSETGEMTSYVINSVNKEEQDKLIEKHSQQHVNTSTGDYLDPKIVDKGYENIITVENAMTGEVLKYESKVVDGVSYTTGNAWQSVKNENGELETKELTVDAGQRVVPGGNENQKGLVPGGKETITHLVRDRSEDATYIRYVPNEIPVYYPGPPSYPSYESFTTPEPIFNSDLRRESRFIYSMGIDKIEIKSVIMKESGIRVTPSISAEGASKVSLEVEEYVPEEASIEYYIISGGVETPILPNGSDIANNEKLFPNLSTRFEMIGEPIEIKKNGIAVNNITFEQARNARDGVYSVTYKTKNANQVDVHGDSVQVKIIQRLYNSEASVPYVRNIKANLYEGGNALWQDL